MAVVKRFGCIPGMNKHDSRAEVYIIAARCLKHHDPSRAKFSTYLYWSYLKAKSRAREWIECSPRSPLSTGRYEVPLSAWDHGPDDNELDSILSKKGEPEVWELAARNEMHPDIERAMLSLTPRMRHVITRLLGLDDKPPQTPSQLGAEYGISRQSIQNIKNQAYQRLRDRLFRLAPERRGVSA